MATVVKTKERDRETAQRINDMTISLISAFQFSVIIIVKIVKVCGHIVGEALLTCVVVN